MKILIVGGGVAGPTLSGFLKDTNHDITLIDQAPQWGDIGYAIGLWGNGRKILYKLGVEHAVEKEGYVVPWNVFEDEKGAVLKPISFHVFDVYGSTMFVSRTSLHRALIEGMGENTTVHLGMTITTLKQKDKKVEVTFSDGSQDIFDLVVGADGTHSQVRSLAFGEGFLKHYGWRVWALWTPPGVPRPPGTVDLASGGRIYFVYPLADRAVAMFGVAQEPGEPSPPESRKERLKELFVDFKDSVHHLIDAIPEGEHIFEDDLSYIDMQNWYTGRIVLMGDAQHATSPLTGMGASMAMEDAYVLADELKKTSDVDMALEKYALRREGRIKHLRKTSDSLEKWLMVKSPFMATIRDIAMRLLPGSYFAKTMKEFLEEEI